MIHPDEHAAETRRALTDLLSAVEQIANHIGYGGAREALEEVKRALRRMRELEEQS